MLKKYMTLVIGICLLAGLCSSELTEDCPSQCKCMNAIGAIIMRCKTLSIGDQSKVTISHFEIVQSEEPLMVKESIFADIGLKHVNSITISNSSILAIHPLAFSQLENLMEVKITNSNVTFIHPDSFQANSKLKKLNLAGNPLTGDGSILNTDSVEELIMSNCNLSKIGSNTFEKLSQLTFLDLSGNKIEKLEIGTFDSLEDIIEIRLANNNISEIPKNMFSKNEDLENLDLSNNPIVTFSSESLEKLDYLSLRSCKIQSIPSNMFNKMIEISNLDLSNNLISMIDVKAFKNMSELKTINLAGNNLQSIDEHLFEKNSNLIKISLDDNKHLGELPVTGFKLESKTSLFHVYHFTCNNCGLKKLSENTFRNMPAIVTLQLAHNKISDISTGVLHPLTALIDLDLSHNEISTIDDKTLAHNVNLQTLTLSGNPLMALHASMFTNNQNLQTLDLSNCGLFKLWTLSAQPQKLSSILSLNISNNKINLITVEDLAVTNNLKSFDLSVNPIACSESYKAVIEYLTNQGIQDTEWLTHENMAYSFEKHASNMVLWKKHAQNRCPNLVWPVEKEIDENKVTVEDKIVDDANNDYADDEDDDDDDDDEDDEDEEDDEDDEDDSDEQDDGGDEVNPAAVSDKKLLNEGMHQTVIIKDQFDMDDPDVILLPSMRERSQYSYMWVFLVFITTALAVLSIVVIVVTAVIRRRQNILVPRISVLPRSISKMKKNSGLVYQQLSEERGGPKTPILSRFSLVPSVHCVKPNAPENV